MYAFDELNFNLLRRGAIVKYRGGWGIQSWINEWFLRKTVRASCHILCLLIKQHFYCIRTLVAPLERLKLEYIVRGEQRNLCDLVKKIAASQGLKGFWKGNFVNILRTAPFKAINFYAYDTYRKQLLKLSGHKNTTNFERFVAGAAAGITATVLCLPLDTVCTYNLLLLLFP